MKRAPIMETNLDFSSLSKRGATDMIVLHHTGSVTDMDAGAAEIHGWHLGQGWAGIGYHFVIRKDGTIERGRPEWAVESHAYGENWHTLGIHLSGDFNAAQPTEAQIESAALLIANLCEDYNIATDRDHILGHGELDDDVTPKGCPGLNLAAKLDLISGKANFYRYGPPEEQAARESNPEEYERTTADGESIAKIAVLARKYESSGDPGAVSSGAGDLGGVSYGLYQLASNVGAVDEFLAWLVEYPRPELANYGKVLAENPVNSNKFIEMWKEIAAIDPGNFGELQDEYIKARYYDVAAVRLRDKYYNIEKHTAAMKAVLLSRAVQNGPGGAVELFGEAAGLLGHPNLSYVDAPDFDRAMITAIYDFLIMECDCASPDGSGIMRSPNGFCNGSRGVISGLRNRFEREKTDALNLLEKEA